MKTLKSLLMLCAGLSFCACNSDNEPQLPEGNGAVTVKIVAPQTRVDNAPGTTTDNYVVNGNITLTLDHSGSGTKTITLYYNNGKYYKDSNFTIPEGGMSTPEAVFYNVVEPLSLTASMYDGVADTEYNSISIANSSEPNMQALPEAIPAFGSVGKSGIRKSGDIINDGETDYVEYEASVTMEIPVARLEIQINIDKADGAFAGFESVTLAGAYMDNIKPELDEDPTDYYLKWDNSPTKHADNEGEDAYAILCDNYMTADATLGANAKVLYGTGAVATIPANDKYFAYNIYPSDNPEFKLCLKVVSSDINNPIPAIQYAIVNKFTTDGTTPVNFTKGNIYRVKNLTLSGANIQVDESGAQTLYALTATVTQAQWTVNANIEGSWAQGSNPQ